jgi:hypothetical protein
MAGFIHELEHKLHSATSEFGGHVLERIQSRSFLLASVLVLLSTFALGQTTVIRAARMLDVASGEIRRPGVVVIEGDRIRAVNPTAVSPDATVVELGDATLLPGLMDMRTQQCRPRPQRWTVVASFSPDRYLPP